MAGIARDTDLLLVNRGGVDHQAPASELRRPPVCELEELEDEKMPWEEAEDAWFHIIPQPGATLKLGEVNWGGDLPTTITIEDVEARNVYKTTGEFVGNWRDRMTKLKYPNEYIITSSTNASHMLRDNYDSFKFGPLTNSSIVTNVMDLFSHNWNTVSVDIHHLDTSSVEIFDWMAYNCPLYNEEWMENLDTSSATSMIGMVGYDQKHVDNPDKGKALGEFTRDLSGWCVENIIELGIQHLDFSEAQPIDTEPDKQPQWGKPFTVKKDLE